MQSCEADASNKIKASLRGKYVSQGRNQTTNKRFFEY